MSWEWQPTLLDRCVVVGGSGHVGSMMTGILRAAGADVCSVDLRPGETAVAGGGQATRFLRGDLTSPRDDVLAELRAAALVILAVPETVVLDALSTVTAEMRPGALLADTASVKSRIVERLGTCADGLETVSLNPMFAPSLGAAGRPVVAVTGREGPRTRALLAVLADTGARVIRLTAAQHDRVTAVTQALTHLSVLAFGAALTELAVDVDEAAAVAPPPFTTMLALVARISCGTPEVYWEIQRGNPYAAAARAALVRSVKTLAENVDKCGEEQFAEVLRAGRDQLGPALDEYAELCAALFTQYLPSA